MRKFKNWLIHHWGGFTRDDVVPFAIHTTHNYEKYEDELMAAQMIGEMIYEDDCAEHWYSEDGQSLYMRINVLKKGAIYG